MIHCRSVVLPVELVSCVFFLGGGDAFLLDIANEVSGMSYQPVSITALCSSQGGSAQH